MSLEDRRVGKGTPGWKREWDEVKHRGEKAQGIA